MRICEEMNEKRKNEDPSKYNLVAKLKLGFDRGGRGEDSEAEQVV